MRVSKSSCSLIILCFIPVSMFAQATISGTVTDGKAALEAVSVMVLKAGDSGYVSGAMTDKQGAFSVRRLKAGDYLLLYSLTGYGKKTPDQVIGENAEIVLPPTVLEKKFLKMDVVTIASRCPPIKLEAGKTIINLSAATLGSDGSLLSVLSKIPGVLILGDGTVLLNGQAGATVMIDGRRTYLTGEERVNLLRSIPTSVVDKIELVSQPSARYDASGTAGFINIQAPVIH